MKYGWEWCERVNNHVKNHSKFPNLSAPSLVFKIKDATKGAVSKIHMISLVGDELLTLSKFIGEEPILSYLNAQDQKMVIQTLKLISLFYRDLTDEETRQDGPLFHNIMTWRKLFATSFYGQEPHYLHAVPGSKFNLRCPTLSSLLSVPDVIMFLGPCKFLDTSLFESMHYEWRLGQNAVNGLRNNRDIIQIVCLTLEFN